MQYQDFLNLVGGEPLIDSSVLMAGAVSPTAARVQLSRWAATKRLIQLRRGLYVLPPPYQKVQPHPFLVANRMVRASYVSCQSALAYHGLIPEYVAVTLSVTTTRPGRWETPLGAFEFFHLKPAWWRGYRLTDLGAGQQAFIATPEKALLDLVHLRPRSDALEYLRELRLQNWERLNAAELARWAEELDSPKLRRAVKHLGQLRHAENFETL